MNNKTYRRQRVGKYIIKVLQDLGGSASKIKIKEKIAEDSNIDISYEDVFTPIVSAKSGNEYIPFNFDFNFGLTELFVLGYIEKYNRTTEIVLTEKGRKVNYNIYPTNSEVSELESFWSKMKQDNHKNKKLKEENVVIDEEIIESDEQKYEDDLIDSESIQIKLLELIKKFSPRKFESFSRKLLSKMGIVFDKIKGVNLSNDHGIDGYGIFESDEFRTSKVVIQCKRFTDGAVSEPDIDKFRGVILKHSADYGIFITTTYFTPKARDTATQTNPTITLIDGKRLVELIIKYNLGIKEISVPYYSIENYYNEED